VQSKSGRSYIANAKFGRFDFYTNERDLNYWCEANVPVMLVVYDPLSNAAYWKDVQGYARLHPEVKTSPHAVSFSRRSDLFTKQCYEKLCGLVITDEVELTDFLKDKIRETLRSNLLAAAEIPKRIYHFCISTKTTEELVAGSASFPSAEFAKGDGGFWTFLDPNTATFQARSWLVAASVREPTVDEFLLERNHERIFVELGNKALVARCKNLGLFYREKGRRFYFPPESGPSAREVTWHALKKSATRLVAYPYAGKETGQVAFWVHHSARINFRRIGGQWVLQVVPGYVFTRNGIDYVTSEEVGRLTTRKIARERNQQVLNHLLFWAWFLQAGDGHICVPCGQQKFAFENDYVGGTAGFGIPRDRKAVMEIVEAAPDIDWSELEDGDTDEAQEQE
jgi:hypothetical protein